MPTSKLLFVVFKYHVFFPHLENLQADTKRIIALTSAMQSFTLILCANVSSESPFGSYFFEM